MVKQILIAPNAFKHSLSAVEVANIIESELSRAGFVCTVAPIADGGDGTIDVIKYYFPDSTFVECNAHDPLMRKIRSKWLLLDEKTAVVELAKVSGISLLKKEELSPNLANTFGTGELILSALDKGCRKIILSVGGSATVDAGIGILSALGVGIFDKNKQKIIGGNQNLLFVDSVDFSYVDKRACECTFVILCDVKNSLSGEKGILPFAVQKGVRAGDLLALERGVNNFANVVANYTSKDFRFDLMTGAAGGVPFSMKSFFFAELLPGAEYLYKLICLEEKIQCADLVITGEGSLDEQTLMGKGVFELVKLSKKFKKKIIVICGRYDSKINWALYGIDFVVQIKPQGVSEEESIVKAKDFLRKAVKNMTEMFIKY